MSRDGADVPVSAARERVVLAALLLGAGRTVSMEQLTDTVWGEKPIASARRTLSVLVYRLRKLVGDDVIVSDVHGYRLDLTRCGLDLADFDRLVAEADVAECEGELAVTVDRLRAAEALWRGDPLCDVDSDALHRAAAAGLAERRLIVLERRLAGEIALGGARAAVVELRRLVEQHPLRERLWALLVRALYLAGEQAEALAAYADVESRLAEELGIDPGAELRELHQAVLTGGIDAPPSTRDAGPMRSLPVPRQLPAEPSGFVGRDAEIDQATSALTATPRRMVVVTGPPGVGKSALAVTVGRRLADRFPDGQLFVDLRGFSDEQALHAGQVLPRFLRALGVAPEHIPPDEDEQAAGFRSLVADLRLLFVLDNAGSADHVRPLLPGGSDCAVIVTSRNQLHSLVALDGARAVPLEVLEPCDAAAVLATQVDADRMTRRDAAARIADLCGRLPLALRVAAAHLALRPDQSVEEYADELSGGGRLRSLWVGDDDPVTSAFDVSYAMLDAGPRRMFALLGLVPGPDFTVDAVAALTGATDVHRDLVTLVSASLVQRTGIRYRLHDLVREYARRRAAEAPGASRAAQRRLFDWYVRKTDAAMLPLTAPLYRMPRPSPGDDLVERTGVDWVEEELPNLLATVTHCAEHGPYDVVWQLTDALRNYVHATARETEYAACVSIALDLALRAGDECQQAAMLLGPGYLRVNAKDPERALDSLHRSATLFTRCGDRLGEASAWKQAGVVCGTSSRLDEAVASMERARAIYASLGRTDQASRMATNIALLELDQGRLADAVTSLQRLVADDDTDDARTTAHRHSILGLGLRRLGRLAEATEHLRRGVEMYDRIGRFAAASASRCDLARTLCDAGDYSAARPIARAALDQAAVADDWENVLEAGAVIVELDVMELPPEKWERDVVPTAERMEEIPGHPLYYRWLDVLGRAHLALGEPEKADEISTCYLDAARERSLRLAIDAALTLRTAALVARGRPDEAVETGAEALRRHRETGYRIREARTLCHLGDAHAATGDLVAARGCWCQARAVYTATGTAEVSQADRRLR